MEIMMDQEDVDEDEDINVEDWNVNHDLTNEWEFTKYCSLSILASPIYFQNIKVSIDFGWFSFVLLLVLREEKAALSCTGKGFSLDRGVNPRLISNTDCVFLLILRKNKSMIIQELYRVFHLKKLDSTLCFKDFLWYSEAVFSVNTFSRVGAFTFR